MEEENFGDHDTCFESPSGRDYEKVEAFGLLDKSWFFGNLFKRRTRMSRCYSDPCPSSNFSQRSSAASTKKGKGLARAPSLPPHLGREEEIEDKKSNNGKIKMSHVARQMSDGNLLKAPKGPKPARNENNIEIQNKRNDGKEKSRLIGNGKSSLLRTPSLPVSIGREELIDDENENDIRMSKLIWQAWANSSEKQPQRQTPKGVKNSPSTTPRSRPPRKIEAENSNTDVVKETRQRSINQRTLKKSLSNLEFHDVQRFKDLGYKEVVKQDEARGADSSKAWIVQSYAAQTPNCAAKTSTEDMKGQIKFWARAVATNVRQGC